MSETCDNCLYCELHLEEAPCNSCEEFSQHKSVFAEVERLKTAIINCLNANGHLADGDNCTLIDLKRAVSEYNITKKEQAIL